MEKTRTKSVWGVSALVCTMLMLFIGNVEYTFAAVSGGSLDPTGVPKFVAPLVKPPVFPRMTKIKNKKMKNAEYYEIAERQFQQQILPLPHPATTVWSYGPADDFRTVAQGGRYFYPAFTIETKYNKPVVVKWVNGLVDGSGNPLPHLLPVDPSLHWANPIGRRDTRPNLIDDPNYWIDGQANGWIDPNGNYVGPVPMITHVHGAHTFEHSDGYPEAWYLPAANNIPVDVNKTGTFYDYFKEKYNLSWQSGSATFEYPNTQRATTLWYHDHTLGMTRVNVYAGPAGFYLIRGGPSDMVIDSRNGKEAKLPEPAPGLGIDPFGTFYEIPIAIQDRSFNADGSLFYPDNRAFFEGLEALQLQIPFTFDQLLINPNANEWGLGCDGQFSDVAPIWQPEFFGNMIVVNGQTWPFLDVEQRRYRLRLLNGCNSRFLILDFQGIPGVEVWQIGASGGFLAAPLNVTTDANNQLLMAPAERADVIVDFTNVPQGAYVLTNLGPDEPFGGGIPGIDFDISDPCSTGQVMEFRVGLSLTADTTTPPQFLQLPAITPLVPTYLRNVTLNEEESKNIKFVIEDGNLVYDCGGEVFGPTAALLGTLDNDGNSIPLLWMDNITENPGVGDIEEWVIYNFTADAHPIHIHQIQFQVVNRQQLATDAEGMAIQPAQLLGGTIRSPEVWETGEKDTVIVYPGEVTRVKARYDIPGFFVWHCHIVEHEDNEMMRPYHVGPIPGDAPTH
ncbi:MAG: multicopper oxidase family protein [Planctomycetota bacterium]|jgi:FtsP/CotA-like multicopper oxidase with cupredoxin domain